MIAPCLPAGKFGRAAAGQADCVVIRSHTQCPAGRHLAAGNDMLHSRQRVSWRGAAFPSNGAAKVQDLRAVQRPMIRVKILPGRWREVPR